MTPSLCLAQDQEADALLSTEPLALLFGMLLDQQVSMEWAFTGPKTIADRLGGLDVHQIAEMDAAEFAAICTGPPAVHRYPGSMAKRLQALSAYLVEHYDGQADALWTRGGPDGAELLRRLKALPGYGDQKARIFVALLGKQLGIQADGWRDAAGAYGEDGARRSIADVVDDVTLEEVRAYKKEQKASQKAAQASSQKS